MFRNLITEGAKYRRTDIPLQQATMDSTEPEERTTSGSSEPQLLGDAQLEEILLYLSSLVTAISIFGILSNCVNIVVFYKMGFSVVINISLFCLAIADLLCVLYLILGSCAVHPLIRDDYLVMSLFDIALSLNPVHYFFSAMGAWITAVISVERSCCVAFPIKVTQSFDV